MGSTTLGRFESIVVRREIETSVGASRIARTGDGGGRVGNGGGDGARESS